MLNPMSVMVLFAGEYRRLVLWCPVLLALGALGYFLWPSEPGWELGLLLPAIVAGTGLGACLYRPHSLGVRVLGGAAMALAVGFGAAWSAAHRQPPMPELSRRGTELTGIIQDIAYFAASDRGGPPVRYVTLGQGVLHDFVNEGMPPLRRSLNIRLVPQDSAELGIGAHLRVRVLLQSPSFPAFPGGRDTQFEAWFAGRAGRGNALGPVQVEPAIPYPPQGFATHIIARLRQYVGARIRQVLPGASGTVVATLLDGKAEEVPRTVREDFAASGLAHLLAVAGLHLGIVMGAAMLVCRMGLAAWEWAALRWPCKAIAALVAWGIGGAYVLLTGVHLPAERSWLMSSVVVLGLVVGRRAVSMRGVALAATIMLLVAPQVVLDVAFQMSMAAVMALVAGYEVIHPRLLGWVGRLAGFGQTCARHAAMLVLTSILAGTATLPLAQAE